ncbi:unnamed protein product [Didymodactylos carnosus]|uniref:Uncharacterized protein n=1 Tax=Didymodactylos carnosus TaxID=1234261 RepID=A0A814L1F1_9BILA|nr:unnamed protein product [Didymodactylos carnosus]CAF3828208.1 unnamed protein product [Didymodactylos carnosus]
MLRKSDTTPEPWKIKVSLDSHFEEDALAYHSMEENKYNPTEKFLLAAWNFKKAKKRVPKITFSNTSDKPVSIIKLRGEYEDHDHSLKQCKDVKIGPTTMINTNGMVMRSLIVEHQNIPFELPTKENCISHWTEKDSYNGLREMIAFIYADDCETDKRTFISMYIANNGNANIRYGNYVGCSRQIWYLSNERVQSLQSDAREKNVNEIPIVKQYGNVLALFDPENGYRLYAIRIEITTATSKTVQTLLLPSVTLAKLE